MLDKGFKTVFGEKQVAIDFINATLEGERQVKNLTYLDKEIQPEMIEQRTVVFDLLCEDMDGTKFILEMQNCPHVISLTADFITFAVWFRVRLRSGRTGSTACFRYTVSTC